MDNFKMSITKGITALNVKTNTFMEESKCKTYIVTLENEIKKLKLAIGEQIYEKWRNGEEPLQGAEEVLEQIKAKYLEIEAQEKKILQLQEEEKQILGSANNQQSASGEAIFCSQCGNRNEVHYKFCCKCGKPLR